jgi:hypothetical protein
MQSLFEKREKSSSGGASKSQKDVARTAFKDDTAQAAGDRGLLSRHNSEPEAESVDPPAMKRIASQESSERKESRSIGKKRRSREYEDDQLSLCKPQGDEEVRTNDSVELNKASGDTRQGGLMKSNRSSGRSSFGHMNMGKHPNMSGSCPDLYQQGLSQGAHMPYGHVSDGYGIDYMMPRSKSVISQPNCGHVAGFMPQHQPMQMQMPMQNSPVIFPQYGIQYNAGRMMMVPNQMMSQRYPMMDQYNQYRAPMYHPQHQAQFVNPQRMGSQVNFNPQMASRVDRCPTSPARTQGNLKYGYQPAGADDNPVKCSSPIGGKSGYVTAPNLRDAKAEASSEQVNAKDNDKAPNNNEAMNTSVSVLPDIQDFDLSPEEFDAIFEGFDLPNVE